MTDDERMGGDGQQREALSGSMDCPGPEVSCEGGWEYHASQIPGVPWNLKNRHEDGMRRPNRW